jgi:hypothetical protein
MAIGFVLQDANIMRAWARGKGFMYNVYVPIAAMF